MASNLGPGAAGFAPTIDPGLISYTNAIYALHALSLLIGLTTAATIVGSFVCGIPSIVAVIMNYARRSATYGTFLESHFSWQIRTFWFTVLWSVVIAMISAPLVLLLGLGIVVALLGFGILAIWIIYRVARGWLALRDRRPMYI
jgi:uncharacterized membrane protein